MSAAIHGVVAADWAETGDSVAPGASELLLTRTNTRWKAHSAAPVPGIAPKPLIPGPEPSGRASRIRSADLAESAEDRATHTYAAKAPDKSSAPAA